MGILPTPFSNFFRFMAVDFMWLLENGKAPDHAALSRFRTGRCANAIEDLFYQYVQLWEKEGETDHKETGS